MRDRLHLKTRHRRMLEEILRKHVPGFEVWAYGSRVSGHSHGGSDFDLVLRASGLKEIPIGQLVDLEEALRLSTILFLAEARDWARLPESFHHEIERDYEGARQAMKYRFTSFGGLQDCIWRHRPIQS